MPSNKPNIASLALNLDGCRFGDSLSPHSKQSKSKQRQHSQSRTNRYTGENRHPNHRTNENYDDRQRQEAPDPLSTHHYNHQPHYTTLPPPSQYGKNNDINQLPSPMGGTYRAEGLSIGRNFLRFEGSTLSSKLSIEDMDVIECVGRGVCSSVWKACRKEETATSASGGDTAGPTNDDDEKAKAAAMKYYALKVFPLRDPARRSMLVRELKLLCTFHCDCLVELEGAFLDDDGGRGDCSVTLVLEFMDRGSLSDLTACGAGGDRIALQKSPANSNEFIGSPGPPNRKHHEGDFIMPATPGMPAISSPLFRGLSPPSAEKHRKVPEYAIAAIAYQMLWGLGFLHYEGVLHRDVKPANVLVSSTGRVKLADFGIVSQRHPPPSDDDNDGTVTTPMNHTIVGTTRYMSPERLRGMPYAKPSDVWGVGLVLLEICRGDSPFEDVSSVIELVQTLDECKMSEFIPETTSDGLREILLGCLDHSPQNRIPAPILLSSPWFQFHEINDVDDASSSMKVYLDRAYPPL